VAACVAGGPRWVDSWVSMPQLTEPGNMPPAPFTQDNLVFADSTLRQTIHTSVRGQQLRLRVSNAFGGAALPITAASVARPAGGQAGVSAIEPGTSRPLTFGGLAQVVIPVGAQVVSDPLQFPVAPRSNLTVAPSLAQGQASTNITSHPGSRTTSYMVTGNHVQDADLPAATHVDHWYLISGVEVWSTPTTSAAVMLGDSLTDGRGSATNGNDRWPDQLLDRLQANRATADVAVVNQAAGGNRGPQRRPRAQRPGPAGTRRPGAERGQLAGRVRGRQRHRHRPRHPGRPAGRHRRADLRLRPDHHPRPRGGHRVYGATLTPFGGNTGYDEPRASARPPARRSTSGSAPATGSTP
jgi:hypothetical protein